MLRWAFFDLGGTLLDDLPFHDYIYGTMLSMFAERGHNVTMGEFVSMRDLLVKKRVPILKSLIEHFTGEESLVNPLMKELTSRIEGKGPGLQSPFPEAVQVLKVLMPKYSLGIIANQQVGIHDRLKEIGWNEFFSVAVVSDEVGFSKPDIRIFQLALQLADCKPREAAMVGDRIDNDIAPAKRIGMRTIRFKWGIFGPQNASSKVETPDAEITSLCELPDALARFQ
jgi:FMN phosphatase YigB (HAD superfamily)